MILPLPPSEPLIWKTFLRVITFPGTIQMWSLGWASEREEKQEEGPATLSGPVEVLMEWEKVPS